MGSHKDRHIGFGLVVVAAVVGMAFVVANTVEDYLLGIVGNSTVGCMGIGLAFCPNFVGLRLKSMDYVCHLALLFLQDFELILDYLEKSFDKIDTRIQSKNVLHMDIVLDIVEAVWDIVLRIEEVEDIVLRIEVVEDIVGRIG